MPPAPRPRFVGDTLLLNRLLMPSPDGGARSAHAPEEVSPEELFECPEDGRGCENLHSVLATSYGCDYSFVTSLVLGSPADVAGRVTIFDNQRDHHKKMGAFDEATYPRRTVVMPHFHSQDSTMAERLRMQRGTMHPKLTILEFRAADGTPGSGFLRLVVASANLGRYDSRVNNQYWVHDFLPRAPRAPSPSPRARAGSACAHCREPAGTPECAECRAALGCVTPGCVDCKGGQDWGRDFCEGCLRRTTTHHDLCRFLGHLFWPTQNERPEVYLGWRRLLAAFDLTPPPGVHLIMSVPGFHPEGEHRWWGQWALRDHLQHGVADSPLHKEVTAVEFALSSCGKVSDFRQEMWETFRTGAAKGAPVRIVWPTIAMATAAVYVQRQRRRQESDEEAAAEEEGPGLTIDGRTNIMYGPNDQVCVELRGDLAEHRPAFAHRVGALHHIKIAAGLASDPDRDAGQWPLLSWLYLGSHNLSGAAWGKTESREAENEAGGIYTRHEYVIISYEIGVLIIPLIPRRFALPWASPAKTYSDMGMEAGGKEGVLPFSTARYLSYLHGRGQQASQMPSDAFTATSKVPIGEAARAEVADAEALARKLWVHASKGGGGTALPTLFRVPHGDVRRLLRVRLSAPATQSYQRMPVPALARLRMRHLTHMELVMLKRVGSNYGPVLPEQTEAIVLPVKEFTLGEHATRRRFDPKLLAYLLATGGEKLYVISTEGEEGSDAAAATASGATANVAKGVDKLGAFDSEEGGSACVLLAFFSFDRSRDALAGSALLLQALASAKEVVDTRFWGVVPYDLQQLPAEAPAGQIPEISHSLLVAHECGVSCEADLPALVAVGTRSGRQMLALRGKGAIQAAMGAVGGLAARLSQLDERANRSEWSLAPAQIFPNRMRDLALRQHERASEASAWWRGKGFEMLLVESEGVLKAALGKKVIDDAAAAAMQRRKGRFCLDKNCTFNSSSVAFFRAIFLSGGEGADDAGGAPLADAAVAAAAFADAPTDVSVGAYDAFNGEGRGPPAGRLRADAPKLALVSSLGELEVTPRPGQATPSMQPGEASALIGRTAARLASELGVRMESLGLRTYLAPQGVEAAAPELRASWRKPGSGMLVQALRDAGVSAEKALMVGFDYTDEEAAYNAGVGYIDCNVLFGGEDLEENYLTPRQARSGDGAAPMSFAEARQRRDTQAAGKVEQAKAKKRPR